MTTEKLDKASNCAQNFYIYKPDATSDELDDLFKNQLKRRLTNNVETERKTLIFFCYAGHGLEQVGRGAIAVLNSAERAKMNYPMERVLRWLASFKYCYVRHSTHTQLQRGNEAIISI